MKNKKVIIIMLVLGIGIFSLNLVNLKKEKINESKESIKSNDTLTMMLETEAGTGIYEETIASEWPQGGYVFNTNLSKCENGGIVFWDDENKSVKMKSNISDKCYVYFDKYNKAELNVSVNKDDSSITVTVTSTDEITKYYYSKDGGSNYVESTNNTYTFTNLDNDTSYQIKIYGIDSNGQTTKEYNETIKTDAILTLANYIKNTIYSSDGVNGLYYHDGVGTYTNANQEAGDKSYRYSGANPNNYVCFGSDATTCPEDNLYRIVGLFDEDQDGIYNIKLIKLTIASSTLLGTNGAYRTGDNYYYWNNSTNTNKWSESNLNKINLNTNYWNYLASKWKNLIATTIWKVGGNIQSKIYSTTIKNVYQNEITNPASALTYEDEIGLMYVSDYGYAASPENWKTALEDYSSPITSSNWLYNGSYTEWVITPRSDFEDLVYYVFSNGQVTYLDVDGYYGGPRVRPVFYLNSNATLVSGDGTRSNPYRISA